MDERKQPVEWGGVLLVSYYVFFAGAAFGAWASRWLAR